MNGADDDEAGWQRYDAAADGGDGLPPDGDLRGPVGDPRPECPIVCLGRRDGVYHFLDDRARASRADGAPAWQRPDSSGAVLRRSDLAWRYFPHRRHAEGQPASDPRIVCRLFGRGGGGMAAGGVRATSRCSAPHMVIRTRGRVAGRDRRAGRALRRRTADRWPLAAGRPAHRQHRLGSRSAGRIARARPAAPMSREYIQRQLQDYWTLPPRRRRHRVPWRPRFGVSRRVVALATEPVPRRRSGRRQEQAARCGPRDDAAAQLHHRHDEGRA